MPGLPTQKNSMRWAREPSHQSSAQSPLSFSFGSSAMSCNAGHHDRATRLFSARALCSALWSTRFRQQNLHLNWSTYVCTSCVQVVSALVLANVTGAKGAMCPCTCMHVFVRVLSPGGNLNHPRLQAITTGSTAEIDAIRSSIDALLLRRDSCVQPDAVGGLLRSLGLQQYADFAVVSGKRQTAHASS